MNNQLKSVFSLVNLNTTTSEDWLFVESISHLGNHFIHISTLVEGKAEGGATQAITRVTHNHLMFSDCWVMQMPIRH